jgi:hypothetical protein
VDWNKLQRGEVIALVGGVLLGIGLFLNWYQTSGNGRINGDKGSFSGWDVHHPIVRILLLLAAIAPFILAWIIIREHALSWPRGELTAVVAIAAFGLIFYHGIVSKPGDPRSLVSLQFGFFVALAGSLLMLFGAATRSSETERKRKPPGTI